MCAFPIAADAFHNRLHGPNFSTVSPCAGALPITGFLPDTVFRRGQRVRGETYRLEDATFDPRKILFAVVRLAGTAEGAENVFHVVAGQTVKQKVCGIRSPIKGLSLRLKRQIRVQENTPPAGADGVLSIALKSRSLISGSRSPLQPFVRPNQAEHAKQDRRHHEVGRGGSRGIESRRQIRQQRTTVSIQDILVRVVRQTGGG